MAKPSDPSTVYTSMIKARTITSAAGQEYTLYTADQQLFKVALSIYRYTDIYSPAFAMHL